MSRPAAQSIQVYLQTHSIIAPLMDSMVRHLLLTKPEDPHDSLLLFLTALEAEIQSSVADDVRQKDEKRKKLLAAAERRLEREEAAQRERQQEEERKKKEANKAVHTLAERDRKKQQEKQQQQQQQEQDSKKKSKKNDGTNGKALEVRDAPSDDVASAEKSLENDQQKKRQQQQQQQQKKLGPYPLLSALSAIIAERSPEAEKRSLFCQSVSAFKARTIKTSAPQAPPAQEPKKKPPPQEVEEEEPKTKTTKTLAVPQRSFHCPNLSFLIGRWDIVNGARHQSLVRFGASFGLLPQRRRYPVLSTATAAGALGPLASLLLPFIARTPFTRDNEHAPDPSHIETPKDFPLCSNSHLPLLSAVCLEPTLVDPTHHRILLGCLASV